MSSSVPTVDSILESFPTTTLTKIQGRPTYDSLNQLRRELKSNASAIPSTAEEVAMAILASFCLLQTIKRLLVKLSTHQQPHLCSQINPMVAHSRPNRRSQPSTCGKRSRMA
jgi:hypothetical protein